jgi:hypothetical protein
MLLVSQFIIVVGGLALRPNRLVWQDASLKTRPGHPDHDRPPADLKKSDLREVTL